MMHLSIRAAGPERATAGCWAAAGLRSERTAKGYSTATARPRQLIGGRVLGHRREKTVMFPAAVSNLGTQASKSTLYLSRRAPARVAGPAALCDTPRFAPLAEAVMLRACNLRRFATLPARPSM